jgi:hypothetical protein
MRAALGDWHRLVRSILLMDRYVLLYATRWDWRT